jgi:hypothetical protein
MIDHPTSVNNIKAAVYNQSMVRMIQGSVSWDTEDEKNCTWLLLGIHNKLAEYQAWPESRRTLSFLCSTEVTYDSLIFLIGLSHVFAPTRVILKYPSGLASGQGLS